MPSLVTSRERQQVQVFFLAPSHDYYAILHSCDIPALFYFLVY